MVPLDALAGGATGEPPHAGWLTPHADGLTPHRPARAAGRLAWVWRRAAGLGAAFRRWSEAVRR